jgi:hypothetical protein
VESDLVFNIVWTGEAFTNLRYFTESLVAQSTARFRFIANGCPPSAIAMMEAFRSRHGDRVVEVLDLEHEVTVAHGVALDEARAIRDDGDHFCFIDPDIKANAPWVPDLAALLADNAAVTSGKEVWTDDSLIPENHPGVAGEYFFDRKGFVFGSPHLAMYDRPALDEVWKRWGVKIGSAGPELNPEAKAQMASMGHEYIVYDAGKIVNALLQADGHRVEHRELPQLVHIGGLSHFLDPGSYKTNDKGERVPDWTLYPNMGDRHMVSRFAAMTLRALADGQPPPPMPEGVDANMEGKLRLVRTEVEDLMARYGYVAEADAPPPPGVLARLRRRLGR